MHWRKLLQARTLYYELEPRAHLYDQYMSSRDPQKWESPGALDAREAQLLIDFINQWSTRTPMKAVDLLEGYRLAFPVLQQLKGVRFEQLDLKSVIGADGTTVASSVAKAFGAIATCGQRHESTGASKILHTVFPALFVMWDMRIAAGYGIYKEQKRPTGHEYAQSFLPRVKYEADEAILSFARESGASSGGAVDQIVSLSGAPTFPKLLMNSIM